MNEQIGQRIRTARKQTGLTQKQLGERLGKTGAAVAYMEKGQRRASPDTLRVVSNVVGKPISYFYEDNSDRNVAEKLMVLREQLDGVKEIVSEAETGGLASKEKRHKKLKEVSSNITRLFQDYADQKWQTIMENVTDIILTMDRDGTITAINKAGPGRTFDEVVGRSCYGFLPSDGHADWKEYMRQVFDDGKPVTANFSTYNYQGLIIPHTGQLFPITGRGGTVVEMLVVTRPLE